MDEFKSTEFYWLFDIERSQRWLNVEIIRLVWSFIHFASDDLIQILPFDEINYDCSETLSSGSAYSYEQNSEDDHEKKKREEEKQIQKCKLDHVITELRLLRIKVEKIEVVLKINEEENAENDG